MPRIRFRRSLPLPIRACNSIGAIPMNARSHYIKTAEFKATDCRGATRILKIFAGFNKGKTYPYRSIKRGAKTDGWRAITNA